MVSDCAGRGCSKAAEQQKRHRDTALHQTMFRTILTPAAAPLPFLPSFPPADAFSSARSLQQDSPNQRCPAGCDVGGCVLDSTSGGYKCTKCSGALTVDSDTGKCGCPAGRHISNGDCVDCPKGSYCEGGLYDGGSTPSATTCPSARLTTIGKRSASLKACGEWNSYTVSTIPQHDAAVAHPRRYWDCALLGC
jgi:hypothetical protein